MDRGHPEQADLRARRVGVQRHRPEPGQVGRVALRAVVLPQRELHLRRLRVPALGLEAGVGAVERVGEAVVGLAQVGGVGQRPRRSWTERARASSAAARSAVAPSSSAQAS